MVCQTMGRRVNFFFPTCLQIYFLALRSAWIQCGKHQSSGRSINIYKCDTGSAGFLRAPISSWKNSGRNLYKFRKKFKKFPETNEINPKISKIPFLKNGFIQSTFFGQSKILSSFLRKQKTLGCQPRLRRNVERNIEDKM